MDLPNSYKGVENVQNNYANRTDLHILDGFLEFIKPNLQENQKYGSIARVGDTYVQEVIDLSAEEIQEKEEQEANKLRIDAYDWQTIIIRHFNNN